ncbi:carbohydrate binding domain-containing protein [Streptomyces sp. NBC_00470]|uniref:carbohydrate binding domain-containing protein n=1 Tax=Streptomyces sp. NBC_00470 TaxID=2975753 RepID=UPI00324FF689
MQITSLDTAVLTYVGSEPYVKVTVPTLTASGTLEFTGGAVLKQLSASGWVSDFGYATYTGGTSGLTSNGFWDPALSHVIEAGVKDAGDGWKHPYITAAVPGTQYGEGGFQAGYAEIEADFTSTAAAEYQAHKFQITQFKQDNLVPREAAYNNSSLVYVGNDNTYVERSEEQAVLGETSIKSTLISLDGAAPTPDGPTWESLQTQAISWAGVVERYPTWTDVVNAPVTAAMEVEALADSDPEAWFGPTPTSFCLAPLDMYDNTSASTPTLWSRASICTAEPRRWTLIVTFFSADYQQISQEFGTWLPTHGSWLWDTADFYVTQPADAKYATVAPAVEVDDTSYLGESFYFDGARLMFLTGQMASTEPDYQPARKVTLDMEADRVNLARNSAFTHNLTGWQALDNADASTATTLVIDTNEGRTRGGSALCKALGGMPYTDDERVGMGTVVGMDPTAVPLEVINPGYPHTLSVWVKRNDGDDSCPVRLHVRTPEYGSGFGPNLFTDPGFETGIAGWETVDATTGLLSHDTTRFYQTPGSLRLDMQATAARASVRASGLQRPTDASTTWAFSAFVNGPLTSTTAWAVLLWLDEDSRVITYNISEPFTTRYPVWTPIGVTATAPDGAAAVTVQIQFDNADAADAFYVDDVALTGAMGTGYTTLKSATDTVVRQGATNNLLTNPGFENGLTGWEPYPDLNAGTVTLNLSYEDDAASQRVRSGNSSAQLACRPGADEVAFANLTQRLPVAPGETYYLSGWVRTDAPGELGAPTARVQLGFMDRNGSVFDDPAAEPSEPVELTAGTWTYVSQTVTVPPSAAFVFPRFAFGNPRTNNSYSLDDLFLAQVVTVDTSDNENVFGPWTRLSLTWTPLPGFQPWVDAWIGPDPDDYKTGTSVQFWADDVLFERSEQVGEYFDGGGNDPSYLWEEYNTTDELSRSHYYRDRRDIQYRLEEEMPTLLPHGVPWEIRYAEAPYALAPDQLPVPARPKPPSNDGPYYLTGLTVAYTGANSAVIAWDPIDPPADGGFDFRVTLDWGATPLTRPALTGAAMLQGLAPNTAYTVTATLTDVLTRTVVQTQDITFTTAQIMWRKGLTNYAPDPSFEKLGLDDETGAFGYWSCDTTGALSSNADYALAGDYCLQITSNTDGADHPVTTYPARDTSAPFSEGDAWTVSGWVRASVTKPVACTLSWWTANGFLENAAAPVYVTAPANRWTRVEASAVAPPGATRVVAEFHIDRQIDGETYWLDAAMLTRTAGGLEYGDGDTADWVWLDDTFYLSQYRGTANPVPDPKNVHTSDVAGHSAVLHWTKSTDDEEA